jgi:short-subunit dehydrogenase
MSYVTGKVIWITGASAGIGEALTYQLAEKGAKLILSARKKNELERVKANCLGDVQTNIATLPLDLSKSVTLQAVAQEAIQCFGHIDILVNNGGIRHRGLVNETSLEVDRQIMEVNYFGNIALTKHLLPYFISRKQGHFVIVSSVTGKFGTPYRSGYAASKHALHGFYDALRAEHTKDGIFVTMVCPGFINTSKPMDILSEASKKLDEMPNSRKPVKWCAIKIAKAIGQKNQEVYIGGKEVFMVYVKRFLPSLFSRIISRIPVR